MITIAPVPRHPPLVRITHWTAAASVAALVVSGTAILLAHPRLYWGETGVAGEPSLVDLPLPLVLTGQTGWGRSLHFLSAWTIVITGVVYVVAGMRRGRFRWPHYDALQRRTYTVVVFVLLPLMIWTGLAMSPAIASVVPFAVLVLGGHQSARTIHFAGASALVVFVVGHVVMVGLAGFRRYVGAMITGDLPVPKEVL
jgi:thiosulfate reductase cytochrome b subunit